jgi:hypothetical protein
VQVDSGSSTLEGRGRCSHDHDHDQKNQETNGYQFIDARGTFLEECHDETSIIAPSIPFYEEGGGG